MVAEVDKRYVRYPEIKEMISIAPGTLRKMERDGRFPKRVKLSARLVGWWLPDVRRWLADPEKYRADLPLQPENEHNSSVFSNSP